MLKVSIVGPAVHTRFAEMIFTSIYYDQSLATSQRPHENDFVLGTAAVSTHRTIFHCGTIRKAKLKRDSLLRHSDCLGDVLNAVVNLIRNEHSLDQCNKGISTGAERGGKKTTGRSSTIAQER
jgi:hypothetical protein